MCSEQKRITCTRLGLFIAPAAWVKPKHGDIAGARRLGEEARELLEAMGFKHALGNVDRLLGTAARAVGDDALAEEHFRSGVGLYLELGQVGYAD